MIPKNQVLGFTFSSESIIIAWEQRKLSELGEIITGSTPSTQYTEYYSDNGMPWVTPTDISENITFETAKKLSDSGAKVARVVPKDTILVTCIASIGKNTMLGITGSFNQQINALVPNKEKNNPYFLYTESALWSKQMQSIAAQGTMQIINKTEFSELTTFVPKLSEQQKIGSYFANLDTIITLHQRMAKVYFNSFFLSAWEQRKFSDFTYSAGEKNKNDLPLVPYAITNEHGFIAQSEAHDDFGYMQDVDRTMYIIVKPNSFAYNPARINVGSLGYYEGEENVIVSSLYEVFQTVDDVDDKFLSHWFKTKDFMDWISRLQEGSVRQYFYYDKLCECQMSIPSLDEQHKIGAYFDNLDNLITLHQRNKKYPSRSATFRNCREGYFLGYLVSFSFVDGFEELSLCSADNFLILPRIDGFCL